MPTLSLKSALLLTAYFAVCASVYITQNLATGWIVVIATALLISMAMVSAFKTNDTFTLGFSVFASATLAITLGCIFETSAQLDVWDVRPAIINAMRFGPAPPEIESFALKRCTNWEENTGSSSFPRSLKRCWPTSKRTDRGRQKKQSRNTVTVTRHRCAFCHSAFRIRCCRFFNGEPYLNTSPPCACQNWLASTSGIAVSGVLMTDVE